jgi:hypothetical protein
MDNLSPRIPEPPVWERPSFEVVPLDCEITSYAPEGEDPLF